MGFFNRIENYLPELASNRDPPDFCLLSSWDYRHEPLVPSPTGIFQKLVKWHGRTRR
jgi:hypothetical protein